MKFIPNAVTVKCARQILVVQKHSPRILFVGGVVAAVGATVLACRATLKVNDILDEHSIQMDDINKMNHDGYSERDRSKDKALLLTQTGVKIAKVYAPAIAIGTLSICMLTKSHNMLTQRNAALAAAYSSIDRAFQKYRERVQEEIGEDNERKIYRGVVTEEHPSDPDNANSKKVKTHVAGVNGYSSYAKFFDKFSKQWNPNPDYNLAFLRAQQNYANDLLQARGHVLLNEIYDMLGLERTKPGCVVGWVIGKTGDNYIDFGIFDSTNESARNFVNGHEASVLLDFNVDGVIYDLI